MVENLVKTEKISEDDALKKLEEMTPLAKIVPNAKPKPVRKEEETEADGKVGQSERRMEQNLAQLM